MENHDHGHLNHQHPVQLRYSNVSSIDLLKIPTDVLKAEINRRERLTENRWSHGVNCICLKQNKDRRGCMNLFCPNTSLDTFYYPNVT